MNKFEKVSGMKATGTARQQGIVLFISMIILIMLVLLGLYVTKSSVLQLKMADNTASKSKTLEFAEASRSYAEAQIIARGDTMSAGTAYNCSALGVGYYASATAAIGGCNPLVVNSLVWDATDSVTAGTGERYTVEYLGVDSINEVGDDPQLGLGNEFDVLVFRIVTQGTESTGSETIIETIYLVRKS